MVLAECKTVDILTREDGRRRFNTFSKEHNNALHLFLQRSIDRSGGFFFVKTCITSVIYHPTISSTSSTITSKPDIYLNIYCFLKTRIKSKCIACVWKTWHYIPIDDIVIVEEKENVERKSLFNWEQIYVTDLLNSSFSLRFYICVLCSLIANKIHLKTLRHKIYDIFSVI